MKVHPFGTMSSLAAWIMDWSTSPMTTDSRNREIKVYPHQNKQQTQWQRSWLSQTQLEQALGIHRSIEGDSFRFSNTLANQPGTHRRILTTVASIYDSLGLHMSLHMILWEMCHQGIAWDDPPTWNAEAMVGELVIWLCKHRKDKYSSMLCTCQFWRSHWKVIAPLLYCEHQQIWTMFLLESQEPERRDSLLYSDRKVQSLSDEVNDNTKRQIDSGSHLSCCQNHAQRRAWLC